jgi:hypothetical protein
MSKIQRTSMAITAERKMKLERAAIDLSSKVRETVTWTDVANYMIDFYIKNACADIEEMIEDSREQVRVAELAKERDALNGE